MLHLQWFIDLYGTDPPNKDARILVHCDIVQLVAQHDAISHRDDGLGLFARSANGRPRLVIQVHGTAVLLDVDRWRYLRTWSAMS